MPLIPSSAIRELPDGPSIRGCQATRLTRMVYLKRDSGFSP